MPEPTRAPLSPVILQGSGIRAWLLETWQGILAEVSEPVLAALSAVAVLLIGWLLSRLFVRLFARSIARRFGRPSLTRAVIRSVRLLIVTVAGLYAATFVGFRPGDILISVTVLSAAIGIILAPIVGSIISGLFVLADQPYEIGDMIEIADRNQTGFVDDITLRYTKIITLDNTFVVIPNSTIRDRDVINYSAEDERTRRSIPILVTYECDLDRARELIERAAREVDVVITGGPDIRVGSARYPAGPVCYVDEFADSGVLLTLRYWIKEPYKLLSARSQVQERVERAIVDTDIEIAYPHTHHVFDEHSGEARVSIGNGPGSARSGDVPDTRTPEESSNAPGTDD